MRVAQKCRSLAQKRRFGDWHSEVYRFQRVLNRQVQIHTSERCGVGAFAAA